MKIPIRIYKNSFLASLVSILGSISGLICVCAFLGGEIIAGIIALIISVLLFFAAEYLSQMKCFKLWIKQLEAKGMLSQVANNMDAAVAMYNANPTKMTLSYIKKLNPDAATTIMRALEVQKAAAKTKK